MLESTGFAKGVTWSVGNRESRKWLERPVKRDVIITWDLENSSNMHDEVMISGGSILDLYNFIVVSPLDIHICCVPNLVWIWKENY